jgi:hypothetical protein
VRHNVEVSTEGESYEQWRKRTAPNTEDHADNTRLWDVLVIVLLGGFFVWVGGTPALIGLGLVAVLVVEQVAQSMILRRAGDPLEPSGQLLQVRGGTLLVTLALSAWLIWVEGGIAVAVPLVLVLLDIKDERSFLRWAFDRLRGLSSPRRPR